MTVFGTYVTDVLDLGVARQALWVAKSSRTESELDARLHTLVTERQAERDGADANRRYPLCGHTKRCETMDPDADGSWSHMTFVMDR